MWRRILSGDPAMRRNAVEPRAEDERYPLAFRSPRDVLHGKRQHRQARPSKPGVRDGFDIPEVSADLGQRQLGSVRDLAQPDLLPADLGGDRERRLNDALLERFLRWLGACHPFLRHVRDGH